MDKIIPVCKPVSFSTYDIIRTFKRLTSFSGKIGHGGTLDPFATGVVLLLLGKATARFEEIRQWEKVYRAGIKLGATSTTQDITGEIESTGKSLTKAITRAKMAEILMQFIGSFEQKVPSYSAAKHEGTPLYKLAKKGIKVAKSKEVTVKRIDLLNCKWPMLLIRVTCLGGVYIRQLATDIGEALGCGGFLHFLERERVGDYTLKDCIDITDLNLSQLMPGI